MVEKIMITGGAGYIGSHLTYALANKKKKKIISIDNLSTSHKSFINKKSIFYKLNINSKRIKKICAEHKITSLIHLAASLSVEESEKNPIKYYNNNFLNTIKLLNNIRGSEIKKIIFASTCSVYGESNLPFKENSKINPKNNYGFSKYLCEEFIKNFCKKNNINYAILRYFNVAGSDYKNNIGQINKNGQLIKNISTNILKNKPIHVYGTDYNTKDGTCVRDYIHIKDLTDIHIKVLNYLNKKKNIILNCGYQKPSSVLEVINSFKKNSKNKITIKFSKRRTGDPAIAYANNSKLRKLINFKPKFANLDKIVKDSLYFEKKLLENKI
jgi:UDP-glucose 4-epimerase